MTVDVNKLCSDHAALQYLERVLDVDVGHRDGRTDRDWYAEVCVAERLARANVKESILSQQVLAGITAGANRIVCSTHTVILLVGDTGSRFVGSIITAKQNARPQLPRKALSR